MSAGDVTFIGWTGGSTNYKELAPSLTYEPVYASANFIKRKLTRKMICFDKDKMAVIQGLQFQADLTVRYIDTDGTAKTYGGGGGWTLQSIDDSPYKTGYSMLTVMYSKEVPVGFEFNLPENLSITCEAGVASIKYRDVVLESFDNGTGRCGKGLRHGEIGYGTGFSTVPDDGRDRGSALGFGASSIDQDRRLVWRSAELAQIINDMLYVECTLFVDDTPMEKIEVRGKDIKTRATMVGRLHKTIAGSNSTGTAGTSADATLAAQAYINSMDYAAGEKDAIRQNLASQYQDTQYTRHEFIVDYLSTIEIKWTRVGGQLVFGWEANVEKYAQIVSYSDWPRNPYSFSGSVKFVRVGNHIRLMLGDIVWKQYDVTGLDP
jgi:tetrahydromethanopterin S-methyltransferase subunit F